MLPEDCKNCDKPKTIFFTQIVDGKIKKFDLCADCPHAKAVNDPAGFGLAEHLTAVGIEGEESAVSTEPTCPNCAFTLSDFRKTGRLGCSECYNTFFHSIEPAIKPMHRGVSHLGKVPQRLREELELRRTVTDMESELQVAVEAEDYERAAELRDRLKDFGEKLTQVASSEELTAEQLGL